MFRSAGARTDTKSRCISVKGINIWNKLDCELKTCNSIKKFKRNFKTKVIERYKASLWLFFSFFEYYIVLCVVLSYVAFMVYYVYIIFIFTVYYIYSIASSYVTLYYVILYLIILYSVTLCYAMFCICRKWYILRR